MRYRVFWGFCAPFVFWRCSFLVDVMLRWVPLSSLVGFENLTGLTDSFLITHAHNRNHNRIFSSLSIIFPHTLDACNLIHPSSHLTHFQHRTSHVSRNALIYVLTYNHDGPGHTYCILSFCVHLI